MGESTAIARKNLSERIALALFCLVLAFRFVHVYLEPPQVDFISDGLRHWENARDTLAESPTANWDPPLFQIYLSVIQKLSGGFPILLTWYTALLSASLMFAWLWPLLELFERRQALVLASLFGLVPEWVSLYSFLLNETLFLPLLACSLGATFTCGRRLTLQSFLVAGTLWLLCALTRGIGLPLAGVAVLYLIWKLPHKVRIQGVVFALFISLSILLPLSYRSFLRFQVVNPFGSYRGNEVMARTGAFHHHTVLTRDGARWEYFFDSARGTDHPLMPFSDHETIRKGSVTTRIDLSQGQYQEDISAQFADGLHRLYLILDDAVFTLFGVPWPHISDGSIYGKLGWYSRWAWGASFLLLPLICLLRYPLLSKEWLLLWLIVAWAAVQLCGLFIPGQSRYRLPFEAVSLLLLCSLSLRRRNHPDPPSPARVQDGIDDIVTTGKLHD